MSSKQRAGGKLLETERVWEVGSMATAHRRHDMTDAVWERLRPHLPGGEGKQGRPAQDNRRFIDAVCWMLRTGAPWRDLPPDYGDWKNAHRRFCRWRDRGEWAKLLEALIDCRAIVRRGPVAQTRMSSNSSPRAVGTNKEGGAANPAASPSATPTGLRVGWRRLRWRGRSLPSLGSVSQRMFTRPSTHAGP